MEPEPDLGPLLDTYRGRPLGRGDLLSLVLPGALVVLAPLAWGVWRYQSAYSTYGPAAAEAWSQDWFWLSGLLLVAFLAVLLRRVLLARRFVAVHKAGLRLNLPAGRLLPFAHPYSLRWEQIAGIATETVQERFLGLDLGLTQRAVLYPSLGRPRRLDGSLQRQPELVSRLKAGLYPRLLPGLSERLKAGQWLWFGPLDIQGQALRLPPAWPAARPEVPWSQVRQIGVQAGYLTIEWNDPPVQNRSRNRPLRIAVSQIPNLEILLQLVRQGIHA